MMGEHRADRASPGHATEAWPWVGFINADTSMTNLQIPEVTQTQAEKERARSPRCSCTSPEAPHSFPVRDPMTPGAERLHQATTLAVGRKKRKNV